MTSSIRTFLLINLLLSITLITSLAIIANLFLEHKDLQKHLDLKLIQAAYTIQAFLPHRLSNQESKFVQQRIDRVQQLNLNQLDTQHLKIFESNYEKILFQVLDKNGKAIIQSNRIDQIPNRPNKLGLNNGWTKGEPWRIFITDDKSTGYRVIVAERYDFSNVLEGHVTKDSIIIMLLMYPFLGFLIWIIVGRGLNILQRVTNEVQQRAPGYLKPVDIEQVPVEIKPLITELNKLFARLHQAFERDKRFAADAAHELRTPLAALKAHAQIAVKSASDAEKEDALQKVITGVDRSTHIMQQLLTMSRMVPEAEMDRSSDVNLATQCKEVISELVPDALAKHSEIELIAPEEISTLKGNPTAISILIRNLVDNAIRYSPANSLIQVILKETTDKINLMVIDNGPGIPKNLRGRVFERFFRILGTNSAGSGLGLGIVQQIAELHNAKVELSTPENGQGLKVTVGFTKQ
jgi:two-component system, OmpR family, sensor histidine kinase QseC